jgi:hypothetical protein
LERGRRERKKEKKRRRKERKGERKHESSKSAREKGEKKLLLPQFKNPFLTCDRHRGESPQPRS